MKEEVVKRGKIGIGFFVALCLLIWGFSFNGTVLQFSGETNI